MSADNETIIARLAHLCQNLQHLQQLQRCPWDEFQQDFRIYRSAERLLQLSAESLFDIGQHLIAAYGLRQPETYREIVTVLAQANVLPKDFAASIEGLAGFQNILVHEYLEVDLRTVYDVLQHKLVDFETFAQHIVRFMEGEGL